MLGPLVIINSLNQGIRWYNGNTACNVATVTLSTIGDYCHKQEATWHHICVDRSVSNGKPRSLPSVDGQQAIVK